MAKTHFLANWMARGKATIPPIFHQRPHGSEPLGCAELPLHAARQEAACGSSQGCK